MDAPTQGPFRFRSFAVQDDRCSMRVGTDGVLLGAWARIGGVQLALDVGTGSGLIAIMLASRSPEIVVDAIEIDADSAAQASDNVAKTAWSQRVRIHPVGITEFALHSPVAYDLVICNPPFFDGGTAPSDVRRSVARHREQLCLSDLFGGVSRLLSDYGRFALVVPYDDVDPFLDAGDDVGLHACRRTDLRPMADRAPHRSLLEMSWQSDNLTTDELVMYTRPGVYTEDYWRLTEPFYLPTASFRPR